VAMTTKNTIPSIALTLALAFACQDVKQKETGTFSPLSLQEVYSHIHPSYAKKLAFTADLEVERRDDFGASKYTGRLSIDRNGTSILELDKTPHYEMTLSDTLITIPGDGGEPLLIDLTSEAHNVLLAHYVPILESNPFRYLYKSFRYFIQTSNPDTTFIRVEENLEKKKFGDVKITVHKKTGFILEIYFYSISGDLGRHVQYRRPRRIDGEALATEMIMDYAAQGSVIRERFMLKNIVLR
jgi:hypothetical protein